MCEPDATLRGLVRSFERVEDGIELGDLAARWSRDDEGAVCVRWGEVAADGQEESVLQLRPDPEAVVEWLGELSRSEIMGPLFLRWLEEIRVFRDDDSFEQAKR
jgi:hypothetical protein